MVIVIIFPKHCKNCIYTEKLKFKVVQVLKILVKFVLIVYVGYNLSEMEMLNFRCHNIGIRVCTLIWAYKVSAR